MKTNKLRSSHLPVDMHSRLKIIFRTGMCLLLAFALHGIAYAQQQIEITGVVSAPNGETLPGVSVVIEGTTTGTATDINGE